MSYKDKSPYKDKLQLLSEGKAKFQALVLSDGEIRQDDPTLEKWELKDVPTKSMPVFYNPKMMLNRDISILALNAWKDRCKDETMRVADIVCGIGIRGTRYLMEVRDKPIHVDFVDLNPAALEECAKNLELNGILPGKYTLHELDANEFLHGRGKRDESRIHVVDIDPFVNPMNYINGAFRVLKRNDGLMQVNATDLAVLAGPHARAARRKYHVKTLRNVKFHAEMSIRIILGAMFQKAAELDFTFKPLFSIARNHFIKVIVEKIAGAGKADADYRYLGYMIFCRDCKDHFTVQLDDLRATQACKFCGSSRIDVGGPIWTGAIEDADFCNTMKNLIPEFQYLKTKNEIKKILEICAGEAGKPPGSHDIHELAGEAHVTPPDLESIIVSLKERGWNDATRDSSNPVSIKTAAPREVLVQIMKNMGSASGDRG